MRPAAASKRNMSIKQRNQKATHTPNPPLSHQAGRRPALQHARREGPWTSAKTRERGEVHRKRHRLLRLAREGGRPFGSTAHAHSWGSANRRAMLAAVELMDTTATHNPFNSSQCSIELSGHGGVAKTSKRAALSASPLAKLLSRWFCLKRKVAGGS